MHFKATAFPRIEAPASISTITSDPRPVFEAWLVFKARLLFEEIRYV